MEQINNGFTNIKDVDREILLLLDAEMIDIVASVSKYIYNLCNMWLWRMKFSRDYVDLGNDVDYRDLYHRVIKMNMDELLLSSVENSHLKLIEYALNHGANIHVEYDTIILVAITGSLSITRHLYDKCLRNKKENRLIYIEGDQTIAAMKKIKSDKYVSISQLDSIRLLINYGANVGALNNIAIIISALQENHDLMQLLIDHGADINTESIAANIVTTKVDIEHSRLPLICIVSRIPNVNIAKTLINNGINFKHYWNNYIYPIWEAILHNNVDVIKLFLDNYATIHLDRNKSLLLAVEGGNLEIVQLLLDNNANIHTKHDEPLIQAAIYGHLSVAQLLLDHGADIHAQNDKALIEATMCGHYEIVRLLLDHGADIHAQNDKALIEASKCGHYEIVRLLLDHGADIHAQNDKPLKEATKCAHENIISLLIDSMI